MKNILLPVDLAHESSWQPALPLAIDFARNHAGKLHLLTVVRDVTSAGLPMGEDSGVKIVSLDEYNAQVKKATAHRLETFAKKEVPEDVTSETHVSSGSIYREILKTAETVEADVIVISAYRPSLRAFLLGHNAERVARHAHCSVFIVRP